MNCCPEMIAYRLKLEDYGRTAARTTRQTIAAALDFRLPLGVSRRHGTGDEGWWILDPNAPVSSKPIAAGVRIGHVHLKVADLERALAFYCSVLGFAMTQRLGRSAAFVSAGGYHHHIGLNTWESRRGAPETPAQGRTGRRWGRASEARCCRP